MQLKTATYDVGVIVGRFQVPELHDAHKDLIQTVCDRHDKVIIFLGLSPLMNTLNNPLDFESRKQMILDQFPKVNVLYVKDQSSDEVWSAKLDEQVSDLVSPAQSVVLYGSRDSFIVHYMGRYPVLELEQETFISGSEIRKDIARKSAKRSPEWRAGVIWASQSRYPTCFVAVDIAILSEDGKKILLGRKPNEKKFRFIGGFVDPTKGTSLEQNARREVMEETGVELAPLEYVSSQIVDDWRYRAEVDKIMSVLFKGTYMFGAPKPDDDIAELRWFDLDGLKPSDLVPTHHPLLEAIR